MSADPTSKHSSHNTDDLPHKFSDPSPFNAICSFKFCSVLICIVLVSLAFTIEKFFPTSSSAQVIQKLDTYFIPSTNVQKAQEYYESILGGKVQRVIPFPEREDYFTKMFTPYVKSLESHTPLDITQIRLGNALISLIQITDSPIDSPKINHYSSPPQAISMVLTNTKASTLEFASRIMKKSALSQYNQDTQCYAYDSKKKQWVTPENFTRTPSTQLEEDDNRKLPFIARLTHLGEKALVHIMNILVKGSKNIIQSLTFGKSDTYLTKYLEKTKLYSRRQMLLDANDLSHINRATIGNEVWCSAPDNMWIRYHTTLFQSAPKSSAIGEMKGKIHKEENVLKTEL